jgi:hypothetical protein
MKAKHNNWNGIELNKNYSIDYLERFSSLQSVGCGGVSTTPSIYWRTYGTYWSS